LRTRWSWRSPDSSNKPSIARLTVSGLIGFGHFPARLTSLVSAFIDIVASHFRRLITSLITVWTVAMSDGLPRPFLCPSALRAVRRALINLRPSFSTSLARKISVAL